MADISFTLLKAFKVQTLESVSSGPIAVGDLVRSFGAGYLPTDSTSLERSAAYGLALTNADAEQYFSMVVLGGGGEIVPGDTIVSGETYFVSKNSGKICPSTDLTDVDFVTQIGVGNSSGGIALNLLVTGDIKGPEQYQGEWSALENEPDILTTPVAGYWYCIASGVQDLGAGPVSISSGSTVLYDGAAWTVLPG